LDGSIKQLHIDTEQIVASIKSTFACHRDVLQGTAEPADHLELDAFIKTLSERRNDAQGELRRQIEEQSGSRSSIAGLEALVDQNSTRLAAATARKEELTARRSTLRHKIDSINAIIMHESIAGAGVALLPNQATPDEVLETAVRLEEETKELVILAKSEKIFRKRFAKAREQNPSACPCCGQDMDALLEKTYDMKLKNLLSVDGANESEADKAQGLAVKKEQHKQAERLCVEVRELHSALQPLAAITLEVDIIDAELKGLTSSASELRAKLHAQEGALKHTERTAAMYVDLLRELSDSSLRWQSAMKRSADVQEKKRRQTQSLLSFDLGDRTLEDVELSVRASGEEKDKAQSQKDRLVAEESGLQKRYFTLKAAVAESEKALSDARISGAKSAEIESVLAKLQSRSEEIDQRKATLTGDRDVLGGRLNAKTMELTGERNKFQAVEEEARGRVAAIKIDMEAFEKLVDSLRDCQRLFAEADLPTILTALAESYSGIAAKEEDMRNLSGVISTCRGQLVSQEHTKRNMAANIDLRKTVIETRSTKEELERVKAESGQFKGGGGGISPAVAAANREQYNKQLLRLTSAKDTLVGKLEVFNQQVDDLKRKLTQPAYKNVEERHRRKNVEYETTNMAVTDLDNYSTAV
jgi:DNA repair protein RAD50